MSNIPANSYDDINDGVYSVDDIQSNILEKLQFINVNTGNRLLDSAVNMGVILLATYMFKVITTNVSLASILGFIQGLRRRECKSKIVISGKKIQWRRHTQFEYSLNFFAVLHKIRCLKSTESFVHELQEVMVQDPSEVCIEANDSWEYSDYEDESEAAVKGSEGIKTSFVVAQVEEFKFEDDVYGIVDVKKEGNGTNRAVEEFTVNLYSYTLTMNELHEVLRRWVHDYEQLLQKDEVNQKYYIYTPGGDQTEDYYCPTQNFTYYPFESGKSFDNIFYPEKEEVLRRLDFFLHNKRWYKQRGIPYTLGFLFHGEPGCGKTSTIKAIANYTGRHIVSIPLTKIRTLKELLRLFYDANMRWTEVPLTKRLYVLEDIDAAELDNVVGERASREEFDSKKVETDVKMDWGGGGGTDRKKKEEGFVDLQLLSLLKSSVMDTKGGLKVGSKLSLASLLEVLDGVVEMDGRMIIITTNYPDRLDKALTRPGRIDMQVKFTYMVREDIIAMYEHYYETPIPDDFDKESILDQQWTPAEVTQVFLNNMHDLVSGLKVLASLESRANGIDEECESPGMDAIASAVA